MSNLAPNPARFVAASAIVGAAVPFAAATVVYTLAPLGDRLPHLLWVPAFVLALALQLLWPPIVDVIELVRQGVSPDRFLGFLVGGAFLNGVTYAALGALLWYALYRRQWAWPAFAGVLILFWLRPSGLSH